MNIPDKAIEAAAKADFENAYGSAAWPLLSESAKDAYREGAHKQLEAAAPFIAAQALRDHASNLRFIAARSRQDEAVGLDVAADIAKADADDLDTEA